MEIKHVFDFNKALAHGPYAWPGGYPCYFVMSDGEALSFKAAQENAGQIRDAIIANDRAGWRAVALEINWEDNELTCAHTGERIESAYGETDDSAYEREMSERESAFSPSER